MSFENTSYVLSGATIAAVGQQIQAGGQTITAGGQSITAGGQTITAGGQTITAGGQSITAGGLTVTGGVTADMVKGGVSAVTTVSNGATIATSGLRIIKATVSGGAAASNLVLASGLVGQEVVVINENASGTSTLVITGSVIATSGTTTITISGLAGKKFAWDDTQNLWVGL